MSDAHLIVVGGGIGGAAAALRAAQYELDTVWILGDRRVDGASRAAYVLNIDNMLGVHPAIVQDRIVAVLGREHPEAARAAAEQHLHISARDLVANARARIAAEHAGRVRLVEDRAVGADREEDRFRIRTARGEELAAASVILSTGVMDRQPVVHKRRGDREIAGIHWVFPYANQETLLYCVRCEGHLTRGRRVALLGAGDAAAEVALMVRERYGVDVAVLTGGEPIAWSEERGRLLGLEGIAVREERIVEVEGADRGATLRGFTLGDGTRVEVDIAIVAMGLYRVYNDLARALGADLEGGDASPELRHVLVDRRGETSVPGLFAIGDMARGRHGPLMKQIYTAQEYAVRAVDTIDSRRRRALRAALLAAGAGKRDR
ncbi:MAG: NAD(P)/FAD-dependent oxidoreductase [Acidobacteriota bacterium]